jgi:peptidyl-prolyl cis-trans isomerase SurA
MKRLLLASALFALPQVARAEMVDRIAAVVNTDLITLSEVQARAAPELAKLRVDDPTKRAEQRNEILKKALDILISDKLMELQIKEFNIEATDAEIELAIEDVKKGQNLTSEQFENALLQEGFTMTAYKTFMRKFIARQKLVNLKVRNKIKISDEDLKAEYAKYARDESLDAEVHVRQILVQLPTKATNEQVEALRQKAAALAAEARKPGVDFAELAKQKSEGPSKADGGDLPFFRRGVMVPEFERASFTLPVNGISDPIRTKLGWHVLKVIERRALAAPAYDEVKDQLRQKMMVSQMEHYTEQYVQELRASSLVEVKL